MLPSSRLALAGSREFKIELRKHENVPRCRESGKKLYCIADHAFVPLLVASTEVHSEHSKNRAFLESPFCHPDLQSARTFSASLLPTEAYGCLFESLKIQQGPEAHRGRRKVTARPSGCHNASTQRCSFVSYHGRSYGTEWAELVLPETKQYCGWQSGSGSAATVIVCPPPEVILSRNLRLWDS